MVSLPQGREAAGVGGPVEQAHEPQHGHFAPAFVAAVAQEPLLVGGHGPERVPAVHLLVGLLELHAVALADVAVEGAFQESAEQGQRERVAFHVFHQRLEFLRRAASRRGF